MKKIVVLVLMFTLIFSLMIIPNTVSAAGSVGVFGDANGDGVTDIRDLVALKRYLASSTVTIDESASDINGDSKIDADDLTCLIDLLLGKYVGGANWPSDWSEALSQLE